MPYTETNTEKRMIKPNPAMKTKASAASAKDPARPVDNATGTVARAVRVLRAIAEINACNNQFAPEWIAPFNTVIRRTIEA